MPFLLRSHLCVCAHVIRSDAWSILRQPSLVSCPESFWDSVRCCSSLRRRVSRVAKNEGKPESVFSCLLKGWKRLEKQKQVLHFSQKQVPSTTVFVWASSKHSAWNDLPHASSDILQQTHEQNTHRTCFFFIPPRKEHEQVSGRNCVVVLQSCLLWFFVLGSAPTSTSCATRVTSRTRRTRHRLAQGEVTGAPRWAHAYPWLVQSSSGSRGHVLLCVQHRTLMAPVDTLPSLFVPLLFFTHLAQGTLFKHLFCPLISLTLTRRWTKTPCLSTTRRAARRHDTRCVFPDTFCIEVLVFLWNVAMAPWRLARNISLFVLLHRGP